MTIISNTLSGEVSLGLGGYLTITSSGTISSPSVGVFASYSTIINSGSISSVSYDGVKAVGSTITNSGSISGYIEGVYLNSGTITNSGSIYGGRYGVTAIYSTLSNSGTISSNINGVVASYSTVSNSATISSNYIGVYATDSTITNFGYIDGVSSGVTAVHSTVSNFATISGNGIGVFAYGSAITNSGSINGAGGTGVYAIGSSITNYGSISGFNDGVYLNSGTITNSGSIYGGGIGVYLFAGGTVTNAGTIFGGSDAVILGGSGENRLIVDPGGAFTGAVEGSTSATNTLELAQRSGSTAGTLNGIGSQFIDFSEINIDSGASWSISGDVAGLAEGETITGFGPHDTVTLTGVPFTGNGGSFGTAGEDTYTVAVAGTLTIDAADTDYNLLIAGATVGQTDFVLSGDDLVITEAACFAAGTRILTAEGQLIAVEDLRVGEKLETYAGEAAEIIWIGHRTIAITRHPRAETVQPVLISAGALGRSTPWRDLMVSPDHAMYLNGHLIPAKALVNGFSIRQLNRSHITYFHIEFAEHAVLFAEGAAAESYLDTGNRCAFENGGPALVLHPDFAQALRKAAGCAPFAEAGPAVQAVRQRILDRACIETTDDPALTIHYEKRAAIIVSRSAIPGEIFVDPRDRRRLGVKIASLQVDGHDIPLDHPALTVGWHDLEPDGRWTNGSAEIPTDFLGGSKNLQVSLAATLRYPLRPMDEVRSTKKGGRAV